MEYQIPVCGAEIISRAKETDVINNAHTFGMCDKGGAA